MIQGVKRFNGKSHLRDDRKVTGSVSLHVNIKTPEEKREGDAGVCVS